MRSLTLPLEDYNKDLQQEFSRGYREAMRRFVKIQEEAKKDPEEAIQMIVEDFEGDQISIDRMLFALGLMDKAQELWSK